MRADRLLSALLLLQAHGRLTGRELARRLEVSGRTVHRDMEALSAAGVPVFALRGSRGGWQLEDGWRTQVPGLDEAELRALLMAQPRMIGDVRLAGAAERAIGKLLASLPVALRAQAASMRQRLYVDATGWRGASENLATLPIVQEAVSRDLKLAIHYRRRGEDPVERVVDPLGLVAKGSIWYLVAGTPDGCRTYRVSRIEQARLLQEPSVRPAGFDLAAYWKSSSDRFRETLPRYDAMLRLEPGAASWLKRSRPPWSLPDPDAHARDGDGWIALRVQFDCEEEACSVVLGLGPRVDVIEPASLRDRVSAEAAAVVERATKRRAQREPDAVSAPCSGRRAAGPAAER
jgi:predicted DNA-binding transcriptional regulator YafY